MQYIWSYDYYITDPFHWKYMWLHYSTCCFYLYWGYCVFYKVLVTDETSLRTRSWVTRRMVDWNIKLLFCLVISNLRYNNTQCDTCSSSSIYWNPIHLLCLQWHASKVTKGHFLPLKSSPRINLHLVSSCTQYSVTINKVLLPNVLDNLIYHHLIYFLKNHCCNHM